MDLDDILEASRIELVDHWYGMNPLAPFETSAELERSDGGGMEGHVTFSIGHDERKVSESRDVSLTARQTKGLLTSLAEVVAVPGEYERAMLHTDDFPSISIELTTPSGRMRFFSESQGKHHEPWGLRAGEKEFAVNSPAPGKVLLRLRHALGAKRLDEMIEEADRNRFDY